MTSTFYKYHGTGNDFIMIDDRSKTFPVSQDYIARLCHRRFGIGADGLILLQSADNVDFRMVYFNADGNQSTMCGNGGRCTIKFARDIGLITNKCAFIAIDGLHEGFIDDNGMVHLKMTDVKKAVPSKSAWFIDTGSPHHVQRVEQVAVLPVQEEGKTIRNAYGAAGSNVNFVEVEKDALYVRTYERGVEDETLSCGTGVTASALTAYQLGWLKQNIIPVKTPGGNLEVRFESNGSGFENVWLIGPAVYVYHGQITL